MNTFVVAISKAVGQTFQDMKQMVQEYEFHLELSRVINTFGTIILPSIPESEIALLDGFCNMLMAFSNHPSLLIFSQMITLWSTFYSPQSKINKNLSAGKLVAAADFFAKFHKPLVTICCDKSLKELGNPDNQCMYV